MLPAVGGKEEFAAELDRIRALPGELVAFEFLRPLWDHSGDRDPTILRNERVRARVRQRVETMGADPDLAELLFDDPAELRERFLTLLVDYWLEAFASEWERIAPSLAAAVEEGRGAPVYSLLDRLQPRLRVDHDRHEFGIDIPHSHRVLVAPDNPLTLTPSAFVWPHLHVNCDAPFPLALVYPAPFVTRDARPRVPDQELLALLRALGDDTRLRALRLIAQAPRSTQELAVLVGISEAGLSRHLRVLAEAGVVESRREGYYVVYSVARDRLAAVSELLEAFVS